MAKKFVDETAVAELISKTKQLVAGKQDTLVSGTNLKTINNTSLLGSGNISIGGGGLSVSDLLTYVYPVGSIYMSTMGTSPASFLGGEWTRLTNTFLYAGANTNSSIFIINKTLNTGATDYTNFYGAATTISPSYGTYMRYKVGSVTYYALKTTSSDTLARTNPTVGDGVAIGSTLYRCSSVSSNVGTLTEIGTISFIDARTGMPGGEATHTLTIDEMPSHLHDEVIDSFGIKYPYVLANGGGTGVAAGKFMNISGSDYTGDKVGTGSTGGNQPHNNMPPYLSVYMWKRTA